MTSIKNRTWPRVIALLAVALFTLAACGEDEEGGNGGTGGGGGQEPQFETNEEGVLQVGSCLDYRPFEFIKGGEETGFDVELTEAIAEELGLEVQWVRADFDTIFSSVAAQKFDMVAAASTITKERQQTVDFSDPYYNARQGLSVNTEEDPDIKSTDDIGEEHVIGVQKGTTGADWAKENLPGDIKTFTALPDAFTDLEAGNVDAVVNDEPSSVEEVKTRPGLEVVESIDTDENYGFAFSKENPELTLAVNDALQTVIENGTYEEIFKKYFPGAQVPEAFAGQ